MTSVKDFFTGCHQKDLKQAGIIEDVDTGIDKNTYNMMQIDYLQKSYTSNNSCVGILIFLSLHSIDPTKTGNMLHMLTKNKQGLNG